MKIMNNGTDPFHFVSVTSTCSEGTENDVLFKKVHISKLNLDYRAIPQTSMTFLHLNCNIIKPAQSRSHAIYLNRKSYQKF